LQPGVFVVPKGNPAGPLAQRMLGSMTANWEAQIGLLEFLGNGPTNPRAAASVPTALRRFNPTDPENAKVQLVMDGEWWGKNYAQANQDYLMRSRRDPWPGGGRARRGAPAPGVTRRPGTLAVSGGSRAEAARQHR